MALPLLQPTAAELKAGNAAALRVHIYERYLKPRDWLRPWVIATVIVLTAVGAGVSYWLNHRSEIGALFVVPLLISAMINMSLRGRYECDKALLKEMQEMYGADLPWLEEERQLAAARELEEAIHREAAKS